MDDKTKKLLTWSAVIGAGVLIWYLTTKKKSGLSGEIETRELELFAINDGDLYRQRVQPIIKNLKKKIKSGKYDAKLALKAWQYAADDAAKKYVKEYGSPGDKMFSVQDRKDVAKKLQEYYQEEIDYEG
jgi:hypothetical protein